MLIWTIFLGLAILGTVLLLYHVTLEMNRLDKQVTEVGEKLKERYGR